MIKTALKLRLDAVSALRTRFIGGVRFSAIWMQNWLYIRKLELKSRLNGHKFVMKNGVDAILYRFGNRKLGSLLKSMKEHEWFPRNREIEDRYIVQLNCGETPMYLYFGDDVSLADLVLMIMRFPQKSLWGVLFLGDEQGWRRCKYNGGEELAFAMEHHVDLKMITLLYGTRP